MPLPDGAGDGAEPGKRRLGSVDPAVVVAVVANIDGRFRRFKVFTGGASAPGSPVRDDVGEGATRVATLVVLAALGFLRRFSARGAGTAPKVYTLMRSG